MMWPWQIMLNLVCMLPKGADDERPIALISTLYRIWAKARKRCLTNWERVRSGVWDAAIAGSSALRAAILRALADEQDILEGRITASILWDLQKFYDSIRFPRLIRTGKELKFLSDRLKTSGGIKKMQRLLTQALPQEFRVAA